MSLNHREQRELHRIESRLLRSDAHLAAMLTVFGRLSAGQRMPWREQAVTRLDRTRQAAALVAKAAAALAAAISLLVSALVALFTVFITGSGARLPQPAREQAGPGTNGR
jgi:hypothetical protein